MSSPDDNAEQQRTPADGLPGYHARAGSSGASSSQEPDVALSPAYLVEWSAGAPAQRRPLPTVEDLRFELALARAKPGSPAPDAGTTTTTTTAAGAEDLVQEVHPPHRLFVIHGLPADHMAALRSSLDIDPAFLEAHASRRRYRPLLHRRREARFAHYEYPELVRGFLPAAPVTRTGGSGRRGGGRGGNAVASAFRKALGTVDLMADPMTRRIGADDSGDAAGAVFCRASLWMTRRADVLFLDRPIWRDITSPVQKMRRSTSVTNPYATTAPTVIVTSVTPARSISSHHSTTSSISTAKPNAAPAYGRTTSSGQGGNGEDYKFTTATTTAEPSPEVRLAPGGKIGSLEDVLFETLRVTSDDGGEEEAPLPDLLADLAFERWLDLFEDLSPPSGEEPHDTLTFYWEVTQALEQNLDLTNYLARGRGDHCRPGPAAPDWRPLLERAHRRIDLLPIGEGPPAMPRSESPAPTRCHRQWQGQHRHYYNNNNTRQAAGGGGPKMRRGSTFTSTGMQSGFSAATAGGNPKVGAGTTPPAAAPPTSVPNPPGGEDEGQRSLNRVSYMGGILLPLSIVSGILSMSDPFAPGNPLFWVFWAVSVPLIALSLVVIYADILRNAEVWVEVAAEGVQAAIGVPPEEEEESGPDEKGSQQQEEEEEGEGRHHHYYRTTTMTTRPGDSRVHRLVQIVDLRDRVRSSQMRVQGQGREHQPQQQPEEVTHRTTTTTTTTTAAPVDHQHTPEAIVIDMPEDHPPTTETTTTTTTQVTAPSAPSAPVRAGGPEDNEYYDEDEDDDGDGTYDYDAYDNDDLERSDGGAAASTVAQRQRQQQRLPEMVYQPPVAGSKAKAWRRQQLGWFGAIKAIVGYQRPRRAEEVPAGAVPALLRRAQTY